MQGWHLTAPKKLELFTKDATELTTPDTAKIKIERVLISPADIVHYDNPESLSLPFVLGRYGAGVISKLPEDDAGEFAKMDRVVINPLLPCGSCYACKNNEPALCHNMAEMGATINGVLSNFIDVPQSALYKLPDNVSFEKALFAGHISFIINILDRLSISKGDHVAIFSSTKMGLICAELVSYYGAIPILLSKNAAAHETARSLGVFYTFTYNRDTLTKELPAITGGRLCEKVVYFANSEFSIADAQAAASRGGSICAALNSDRAEKIDINSFIKKGQTLYSTPNIYGNFPAALNLLATNKVTTDYLLLGKHLNFDKLAEELAALEPEEIAVQNAIVDVP